MLIFKKMKMKRRYIIACLAGLMMFGTACKKVLDKQNLTGLSPELVFADSNLVQLNMDNIYDNNLPVFGGQNTGSVLSGTQPQLSEEGYASSNVFMLGTMNYGSTEPTD